MGFNWQVALGTALTGIGERTGQMYDDYQAEQRRIREEDRRYQTELRKVNEKRALEKQWAEEDRRSRMANLPEGVDPDSYEGRKWIEEGSIVKRDPTIEERISDKRALLEAESDYATEQQNAAFQRDLERAGNPQPGTEKYRLLEEKHFGAMPQTVEEQVQTTRERAEAVVDQFWPGENKDSPQYKKRVRQIAKVDTARKTMDPAKFIELRLKAEDQADDRIQSAVDNGRENELLMKYKAQNLEDVRSMMVIESMAGSKDIAGAGADAPITDREITKVASLDEGQRKKAVDKVRKAKGDTAAKEFQAEVEKRAKYRSAAGALSELEDAPRYDMPKPKREPTTIIETPGGKKLTWKSITDWLMGPETKASQYRE